MVSNGDLNVDTRLDVDVGDVLHLVRRAVQVQDALVDSHLEAIKSDGTFTARSLTGHDTQELGWHADRSGGLVSFIYRTSLEFRAHYMTRNNCIKQQIGTSM